MEGLESLAAGAGGTDVAAALGVSHTAVRGYVASAVRRLGVTGRAEALALLRDGGPLKLAG